ncbi:MAG: hypothetical protein ACJ8G1_01820 [Vitreoscilla sp.]
MKRPILFSALLVVLTLCYCVWGLASHEDKVATAPTPEPIVPGVPSSFPSLMAPSAPLASHSQVALKRLTVDRQRIMDSPDVLQTVAYIRQNGTQDQKDWAAFLLDGCVNVRAAKRASEASSSASASASQVVRSKDKVIAAERRQAFERLSQRCQGVFGLQADERHAIKADLIANSSTNSSVLGRLHALISSQEDRWSDDQASLISNSLYSDDPVLQREAFFALKGAIDINAPGGTERALALERAFPAEAVSGQLSEFERLGACAVIKLCASNPEDFSDQHSGDWAVSRLEKEYRAAIQDRKDARSILAIR